MMSSVEPSTHHGAPHLHSVGSYDGRANAARNFLIQLLAREIQLSVHVAGWLRATGQHVAALGMTELSAECIHLAAQTWEQREQLTALIHRLVARRNRGLGRRRINVMILLEQPLSKAVVEFVDVNEVTVASPTPWAELAALSAVEQLLTDIVPLALGIAGLDDAHGDLHEAAQFYEQRTQRAQALYEAAAQLESTPADSTIVREAIARTIETFTKITSESAEAGQQLDSGRRYDRP